MRSPGMALPGETLTGALDRILGYVRGHEGVWYATAAEIAQFYLDNYYEVMMKHLAGGEARGQ